MILSYFLLPTLLYGVYYYYYYYSELSGFSGAYAWDANLRSLLLFARHTLDNRRFYSLSSADGTYRSHVDERLRLVVNSCT